MTSYGSLCRSSGLSKLALRLARPALSDNGLRQLASQRRCLSSIPPRPAERKSTSAIVSLQNQTKAQTDSSPAKETSSPKTEVTRPIVRTSPVALTYTGGATMPITTQLKIVTPQEGLPIGTWPVYRLMVRFGVIHIR